MGVGSCRNPLSNSVGDDSSAPNPASGLLDNVAAPSQLHLPQHGMDAKDSGLLQDFRVRDPFLPYQLRYSAETAEMEVIQLPGLVRAGAPGFRSIKECRQDDDLVHIKFGVQVNTVAILNGGLQWAEGLTSFEIHWATSSSILVLRDSVLPR
ncbi:unnamed protein product [Schistocephalus solidus]|uniref:Uncharacterized protein n=1 Tax=Schistocephalus solidus TaxID=70667 RepID=A0A183SLQ7_SCHSO|nr:unnamed protein product [Schistocephalus solidus]